MEVNFLELEKDGRLQIGREEMRGRDYIWMYYEIEKENLKENFQWEVQIIYERTKIRHLIFQQQH